MTTVFDYFIDFAIHLDSSLPYEKDAIWVEGVRSYLEEIGLSDYDKEDAEAVAKRELRRFHNMPYELFTTFFDYYELRANITALLYECDILAINKLHNGKTITKEQYKNKMDAFYTMASELASDKRYKLWLDELTKDIAISLQFASGLSDRINERVASGLYNDNPEDTI